MKVIVFASSKGGVGKTTLAFNAAIYAAGAGVGVQLADRDPQRSLMDICRRRRETPELVADNPMLLENVDTVSETVSTLIESGYDRDFLLVDTPGSFINVLQEAISVADVVVVPLQPSPMDFLAQEDVVELIEKMGKRDRVLFVLNRIDSRSSIVAETIRAIKPFTPYPPVKIAQRIDYARAGITARAGVEVNKDAAAEINTLWKAIRKVIRKADEQVLGEHGRHQKGRSRR